MQRSTFKVLFFVKRQSEKSGQVPVMGRITINGTMSQFSCKLTVRSTLWDAKANKASDKSLESQRINEKLENIKTNIGKQYQRLCDRDSYVTAEKVRNAFLGMGRRLPPAVTDFRRISCGLPQTCGQRPHLFEL